MSYLSVDNQIGSEAQTTSSSQLQANQLDIYNGTTNFHRVISSASNPLQTINIPNASGTIILNNATQTISNKMNHAQVGSATDPSYSFVGDLDTGMYRDGTNTIGFATAGVARLGISDVDIVSLLPIECSNFQAIGVGSAGNVVFGNSNSTSGMYFDVNRVNFSTNSVARLGITDTQILPSIAIRNIDGNSTSPAYSFSSATNNGMWMNTGNRLAFSISGTTVVQIGSSSLDVIGSIGCNAGTAIAPSVVCRTFGITTTGLFWTATPTLGVAVSGAQAVGFETGGMRLYGSTSGNNALYSASLLGYYEETGAITMTFSFGTNTQTGNIYITRIGRNVTCQLAGDVLRTPSTTITQITTDTAIPLRFRPVIARIVKPVLIGDGVADSMWYCTINGNGSLTFQKLTTGTSAGHAVYSFALSWSIV